MDRRDWRVWRDWRFVPSVPDVPHVPSPVLHVPLVSPVPPVLNPYPYPYTYPYTYPLHLLPLTTNPRRKHMNANTRTPLAATAAYAKTKKLLAMTCAAAFSFGSNGRHLYERKLCAV